MEAVRINLIVCVSILGAWCVALQGVGAAEPIDLGQRAQDFVLEEKQIIIPGFAGAFNASVVAWQGSLLMCFRVRDSNLVSTFEIGFLWLDTNFNPISTPHILEIRGNPSSYAKNQDPRLIVINQRLYILYSNFIQIGDIVTRRMFVAELHCEQEKFFIADPLCLDPFEGHSARWEKNWVPFNYKENLLLAYSIAPHRIFEPSLVHGGCSIVSATHSLMLWEWGELRGGTPALLLNDTEYLAFFHSSKYMVTVHSQGKKLQHYFMGAYTFSARPPFEITRMSPEPIVGKQFYDAPYYNTWKPLRVVFPVGCIADQQYVWVTYGRQDFEIWVAKLDKKKLCESLVACPRITDTEGRPTLYIDQCGIPVDDNVSQPHEYS